MFGFRKRPLPKSDRSKTRLGVERLDERIVPAVASTFDPRLLLARGAAERAISGGGFSPSTAAFNNFTRMVNTFDRLQIVAQQRLNQISNLYNSRASQLNGRLTTQLLNTANSGLGTFLSPTQVLDDSFIRSFNAGNSGVAFVPGTGFVTTANTGGQFVSPTNVIGGGAFTRQFNAQVNQLNRQVNSQFNNLNRLVNTQLNTLGRQMTGADATFGNAYSTLRNVFSTQLGTTRQALSQGLSGNSLAFSNALNNVNSLVRTPGLSSLGFNQFATNFGTTFGQFNRQFTTGLNDFSNSFNTSLGNFNQGFNSGLGDFYNALNSQFNTPSPGFGVPSTGFQFAPNPGLIFPGGTTTTGTSSF